MLTQLARLTVVAALLFMALRPAHAGNTMLGQDVQTPEQYGEDRGDRLFECGDVLVDHQHISDVEVYTIEISAWHRQSLRSGKGPLPIVTFNSRNQTLTVNGKRCKTTEK
jgi:hypothetical protein